MIIPGILERDWSNILSKINIIVERNISKPNDEKVKVVQIDFCDGKYVDSVTWRPFNCEQLIESGLPYWEELEYEADLMVAPEMMSRYIDAINELGFSRVIIHSDELPQLLDMIEYAQSKLLKVGISSRHIENLKTALVEKPEAIDYVQIMGIENIGHQGEPFTELTYNRIKDIKDSIDNKSINSQSYSQDNIYIQIDGGVNYDNSTLCLEAGASNVVMGSAYFKLR